MGFSILNIVGESGIGLTMPSGRAEVSCSAPWEINPGNPPNVRHLPIIDDCQLQTV